MAHTTRTYYSQNPDSLILSDLGSVTAPPKPCTTLLRLVLTVVKLESHWQSITGVCLFKECKTVSLLGPLCQSSVLTTSLSCLLHVQPLPLLFSKAKQQLWFQTKICLDIVVHGHYLFREVNNFFTLPCNGTYKTLFFLKHLSGPES